MDAREDDTGQVGGERAKDGEETARLEELKKTMEAKIALRQTNLNPERPDVGFLRTLDSSIKRNTAVIKKLKQINEEQKESLMEELRSVNLSKFVSEAVTAICDAKLRSSDIQPAVQICALLHQRYKDFSPSLVQGLLKIFFPGKGGEDLDVDKNTKIMKKRSTLKLLLELFFVGVIEDASIFISIIKDLTSTEHLKDRDNTLTNLTLLASFARQGRVFLGLPLTGQEAQEEFFKGLNVTAEQKKTFKKAFQTYYDSASELLLSEHSSLRQMEHDNAKVDLGDDNSSAYEKLRKSFEHLYRNVSSFAESLDMNPPVMPEDANTTRVTSSVDGTSSPVAGKDSGAEPLWDDEDTRAFYECLPDLRAFVPAVLLGESEPKGSEQSQKNVEPTELSAESEQGEVAGSSEQISEEKSEKEVKGKEKESEREKYKGGEGTSFDVLLQRLPNCVSRDLIDQLTVEFCYLNSKSNRKKLVRSLFNVPRTSLELLPYYSRMVATLSICMKDVCSLLLQMLEEEFTFLINKKDQMNIETKIRNIRFIGEFCKFKIAPPSLVFSCLKTCLDDFTHHNIDVACNLLETCGRFLYRSPETTVRMSGMLEILMRLKNVKNLDPRHSTLVENAYYLCKPPERSARVSKVRPPLFQYIRKLLFSDLDKSSLEHVLRQLRKLPWSDAEGYLLKCFMKIHKGKYSQIHLIACLTAGLSRYHEEFAIAVVDELLEQIRIGLEENDFGMQQQRIGHMRFLGELYNYKLVDSIVIFETLYLILSFGHDTAEADTLDPPEDCFRIRMVVTLLLTCGHYFKRKLDRFLLFFQRYILCKGTLPLDIEFDVQDMLSELRPSMTRYSTIEEVAAALSDLEDSGKLAPARFSRPEADQQPPNDSDSETGSRATDRDDDDPEEDFRSNTEDETEEERRMASEEEDEVRVRAKAQEIDPEEAARFKNELKSIMQESMEQRRLEVRGRPTINMGSAMKLTEGPGREHGEGPEEEGEEVQVKVLVKRGSKQHTKQMLIPRDCSLVQSTKQKEAAEFEEKQDIKRLVLEYNDRVEEESHGLAHQALNSGQGPGRSYQRGGSWDGGGRGTPRYRYPHHGPGIYHGRRR